MTGREKEVEGRRKETEIYRGKFEAGRESGCFELKWVGSLLSGQKKTTQRRPGFAGRKVGFSRKVGR